MALAGRVGDGILDAWIFGNSQPVVDCVWVGGTKLVEGGRHVRREQIVANFRRVLAQLLVG